MVGTVGMVGMVGTVGMVGIVGMVGMVVGLGPAPRATLPRLTSSIVTQRGPYMPAPKER